MPISSYKLTAHPTAENAIFDFTFSSAEDMKRYCQFEKKFTATEESRLKATYGTKRKKAKELLERTRRAAYKIWQDRNKITPKERA